MSAKHSPLFWRLFSPPIPAMSKNIYSTHIPSHHSSHLPSLFSLIHFPFVYPRLFFFVFLKSFYSVYSFPDPLFQPLFSPLSVYLPDVFEHVKFIPMVSFHHTPLLLFSTKEGKVFQAKPFGGEKRNSHEANPVYF